MPTKTGIGPGGRRFWSFTPSKRKATRKSMRDDVHSCLDQLELHSPAWVKKIRAYINKLEAR